MCIYRKPLLSPPATHGYGNIRETKNLNYAIKIRK